MAEDQEIVMTHGCSPSSTGSAIVAAAAAADAANATTAWPCVWCCCWRQQTTPAEPLLGLLNLLPSQPSLAACPSTTHVWQAPVAARYQHLLHTHTLCAQQPKAIDHCSGCHGKQLWHHTEGYSV
jgi:hypothetical protein